MKPAGARDGIRRERRRCEYLSAVPTEMMDLFHELNYKGERLEAAGPFLSVSHSLKGRSSSDELCGTFA